jgi:hypothetical protein
MLNHMTTEEITIRPAYFDDQFALMQLAALDSADGVPAYPILLAEVDGELRVALSLSDGSVIADPFHPTTEILELLRTRAKASTRTARASAAGRAIRAVARGMRTGRRTPAWSR